MAFNVTYSFNNGATTGTATNYNDLYNAIHNYSSLTQCTLSGTIEGDIGFIENVQNGLFHYCNSLTSIDLSNLDTSNVTSMNNMFFSCESLTSLNLSNFDTSNVTGMGSMFCGCESLTSLNLSNFDTSNVTIMSSMFYGCFSLTSLNLSNFDISNVTAMLFMFSSCSNLEHIYVGSNWDASAVTDSSNMFYGCTKLPNFNSSVTNKTNAHTGTGGYLTDIGTIIDTAEIYYKYNNTIFKLKEGEDSSDATATADDIAIGKTAYVNGQKLNGTGIILPTIEVTATGSYKPTASSNSNYGACINKDGYMVIYAYSYNTNYEHYNFVNTSIPATFGTIADGWNLTSWDTSDNATHLECCTIKGINVSEYKKIKVALNFSGNNSTYDYVTCNVTITTE